MRFVIIGYGDYAATLSVRLQEKGHNIFWCTSKSQSPSINVNIKTRYFTDINEDALQSDIADFMPDYIISFIFDQKIPNSLIALARRYALNIHPAPLPQVRSGNVWFWCPALNLRHSAISIHKLTDRWDEGDIALTYEFELNTYETQGSYLNRVMQHIPSVVDKLHEQIIADNWVFTSQDDLTSESAYWPRLNYGHTYLDWNKPAIELEAQIRACNPNHLALMWYKKAINVAEASATDKVSQVAGIIKVERGRLLVSCEDYWLSLDVLFVPPSGFVSGKRFIQKFGVFPEERLQPVDSIPEFAKLKDKLLA